MSEQISARKNYIKQFRVHDLTFELYRTGSCFENYRTTAVASNDPNFYTQKEILHARKNNFLFIPFTYIFFFLLRYNFGTTEIQTIHMRSTITSMPYQGFELDHQRGSYLCYRRRHRAIYQYIHKESSLRLNNFFLQNKVKHIWFFNIIEAISFSHRVDVLIGHWQAFSFMFQNLINFFSIDLFSKGIKAFVWFF